MAQHGIARHGTGMKLQKCASTHHCCPHPARLRLLHNNSGVCARAEACHTLLTAMASRSKALQVTTLM
jgi:hypothetical protein